MKTGIQIIGIVFLFLAGITSYSQDKYFVVNYYKKEKADIFGKRAYGKLEHVNSQFEIKLRFAGKTRQQLFKSILKYLNNRPAFKVTKIDSSSAKPFFIYRDFATICDKKKCLADLVALSYIYIVPADNIVYIRLAPHSVIYATIFDAKLRITEEGDVASDYDAPFDEYKFVQPEDQKSGTGLGKSTIRHKLAYPDSIFDRDGKIINPNNKKVIEDFFDGYFIDLKNFLQDNTK